MSTRRLPTGGLAALAVVLAALSVVVVAGSRTHTAGPFPGPRVAMRHDGSHRAAARHPMRRGAQVLDASNGTVPRHAVAPTTRATPGGAPTTTTLTGATTTTTTMPPATTVPTTTVPTTTVPQPVTREGLFVGQASRFQARIDASHVVTVYVPAGTVVTLTVTCGPFSSQSTSTSRASVRLSGEGASCTAVVQIPASSPRPAPWRLVAA